MRRTHLYTDPILSCAVVSDSHYQSTHDAVYVYVVPWSEFPIVPSYHHYPHAARVDLSPRAQRKLTNLLFELTNPLAELTNILSFVRSPADRAGIRQGDTFTALHDAKVDKNDADGPASGRVGPTSGPETRASAKVDKGVGFEEAVAMLEVRSLLLYYSQA